MYTRAVVGSLVALFSLASVPHRDDAGKVATLRFAVLPCTNIESTFAKFQPLLAYLKASAGVTLRLILSQDLQEFEAAVRNGQVDFALQDPHTFQRVSAEFDESSLLQVRALDGTTHQSAVVVVRRGSGLRDLSDLRGRTVMFGPRTSSPKWVAARMLMESRGLSVDREIRLVNGGCCEDIAFAVVVGSADAGVICDHFLSQHRERQQDLGFDPDELVVIDRTVAFPTRVLAARKGIPGAVIASVTASLLRLDPSVRSDAAVLGSAEVSGFLRVTARAYLKEIMPRAVSRP